MSEDSIRWRERMRHALRRGVLLLRLPAGIIATIGLLLALAVHVAAIRGVDSEAEWPRVWLLHGALFPLLVLTILTAWAVADQKTLSFREFLSLVPWPALLLIGLMLVYALANFVLLTPESASGAPVVKDGGFLFNDHGIIREVTEAEYHFQGGLALRLYSSVWVYLYLVAAVFLLGARRAADRALNSG